MDLTLDIVGTEPLLMHNAQLSNPLNPIARAMKKISAKGARKTEDDYMELAHLEFVGALYLHPDLGPFIPSDNVFRALVDAGRKRKLGVKVTSGVMVRSNTNPLAYKGPRDVEGLWKDEGFRYQASVKVGQQRVIRTRPIFPTGWATSCEVFLDTQILDFDELQQLVDIAGRLIGLGDWRPKFGRFEATLRRSS